MTDISDARLTNLIGMGMSLPADAVAAWAPKVRLPSEIAPPAGGGRHCRVCRCTETNACVDPDTGKPCGWAPDMGDLCTLCVVPLETCTGLTPECPHLYCPDGYHSGDDLPCSCTADCALGDDEET